MPSELTIAVKVIRHEGETGDVVTQKWRRSIPSPSFLPGIGGLVDFPEIGELIVGKQSISLDGASANVSIVITLDAPPTARSSPLVNQFGGGDPDELSNALAKSGFSAGAAMRSSHPRATDALVGALDRRGPHA